MLWRGVARNPDGTPLFVVVIEPWLFALACVGATLVGVLAAVDSGAARRAARPGGGDPWLTPAPTWQTLRLTGVRKSYAVGTPVETEVLHGIDLDARARRVRGARSVRRAPARRRCST